MDKQHRKRLGSPQVLRATVTLVLFQGGVREEGAGEEIQEGKKEG